MFLMVHTYTFYTIDLAVMTDMRTVLAKTATKQQQEHHFANIVVRQQNNSRLRRISAPSWD